MNFSYGFGALALLSLISLGAAYIISRYSKSQKLVIALVALAAGSMTSDALIHLLPESIESGLSPEIIGFGALAGILLFFGFEKFLFWRHCHIEEGTEGHVHPFAYSNLIGDLVHNALDGMIIAASFIAGIPVGIATTLAVLLHEIPQEMSDIGIMLHAGMSRKRALLLNAATALSAFVGFFLVYLMDGRGGIDTSVLLPFAMGGFLYIAVSDLIPELKHGSNTRVHLWQTGFFLLGVGLNLMLLLFE